MATAEQINGLLIELTKAFPDWGRGRSAQSITESFELYERALADVEIEPLAKATWAIINTASFFPKIADLRQVADEMQGLRYPSALEAWNGALCANLSNPQIMDIFRLLGIDRGDLRSMDFKTLSVMQSHFIAEYNKRIEKEKRERLLPANLRPRQETFPIEESTKLKKPIVETEEEPMKREQVQSLLKELKEKMGEINAREEERRRKSEVMFQNGNWLDLERQ